MEIKNWLKSFFTQHWNYMAVSTACKLHLFDHLQDKKTIKQLAQELSLNERTLTFLLNALHQANFLIKENDFFKVNSIAEFLTENHPESLKYACMNWSAEHLTAWQNLDFSIQTGKSSFENIYAKSFFDYLNDFPEKLDAYHKAMYEYAKDDYKNLHSLIDFSKHKTVMDVGGGYGAVVENIKAKYPNVECFLFDLEKVVQNLNILFIKKISGSFFDEIPNVAEAIVLSRVLHDWNDEKAHIILKNCYKALPAGGTLYVIENCADKIPVDLSLLSLNMILMCESYERTSTQYIALCKSVGFQCEFEIQLNQLQTILIFKK
ncbi:MAG: methyltransferase [Flammeovirgaceae bacterium]